MVSEIEISASGDSLVTALTYSVPLKIAGQILHRGRSWLYEAAGEGLLDFVKCGARSEVTIESIRRYQASLQPNPIKPHGKRNVPDDLRQLAEKRREERTKRHAERRRARSVVG